MDQVRGPSAAYVEEDLASGTVLALREIRELLIDRAIEHALSLKT
jgi:hypothetical protein